MLYLVEDACDWVWRGPEWARPAVGGLLLGGVLIALPQMYGVGYPVLEDAVEGNYVIAMLLLLMVGKIFANSLTIGVGGSGGVFAPTLFIGAMAGTAFGTVVHGLLPSITEPAGAYGLIGMGAALAGATRAPITAVVILFELTGEYSIILPLMAAVVMATGTAHLSPSRPSTPPNCGDAASTRIGRRARSGPSPPPTWHRRHRIHCPTTSRSNRRRPNSAQPRQGYCRSSRPTVANAVV